MSNFKFILVALVVLSFTNCKKKSSSIEPVTEAQTAATVTTGAASDIGATKAKVSGEVANEGSSTVILRGVCWAETTNPTIENFKNTSGTGVGAYTISLTGLKPKTKYYARAFASNGSGTSYGQEISFTTASVTMTASIAGSPFSATFYSSFIAFGIFNAAGISGSQQISLFLPSTPAVGVYPLQVAGNYDAQYVPNTATLKALTVKSGSIEITEVNTSNGKVKGTFSFVAEEFNVPSTPTVNITNGAFEFYK